MKVIQDDIWLCPDCLMVAVNDDDSGIDYYLEGKAAEARKKDIREGLAQFGPYLVPDFDSETGEGFEEFSWRGCDSCSENASKGGSFHRFAILGEEEGES